MENYIQQKDNVDIDEVEKKLLSMPQVDCPIKHHFGPGLYIREVLMPAGAIVIGHAHKKENMNIMLQGKMLLLELDGNVKELTAPQTFVNGPGRKVAYIIEDVIWQNVHATEETDLEKLEDMFIEKSPAWIEANDIAKLKESFSLLSFDSKEI